MENRRSMTLDFSKIHTYSAENRHNLVRIDNLKRPGQYQPGEWGGADFDALIQQLRRARAEGRQIILSMGAHVVKCGLSPYLIALMREGYITHIAGNGACSIHDFELAYLGGTSEDVPTAIEGADRRVDERGHSARRGGEHRLWRGAGPIHRRASRPLPL